MTPLDWLMTGAAAASSYLLGSVPFGLVIGYAFAGIDIRKAGSGNIGATNAARAVGRGRKGIGFAVFLLVFALDVAKGAAPVLAWGAAAPEGGRAAIVLAAAACAVGGHMFSVFLRFRGGKGVAVGCGVALALMPLPTLAAAGVFLAAFAATRTVSVGSMASALSLPCFQLLIGGGDAGGGRVHLFIFACAVAAAVIVKHRANISRLLKGTENRIGGGNRRNGG